MTSSEDPGSRKAESLFDFLYLDRTRLSSYAAQLFDDGNLTQTKKTSAMGANLTGSMSGGLPGLFKGNLGSVEATNESIERHFDASWAAPLNLFRELNEQGFVLPFSAQAGLGQLVLFKGNIQVLDLRILQKLWEPVLAMTMANEPTNTDAQRKAKKALQSRNEGLVRVAENLPHIIQLRAFNSDAQVWATLIPEALTVNASDLAFKYGPSIPGEWAVLALLDAKPYSDDDEWRLPKGLGDVEIGMLHLAVQLKSFLGRSAIDYGVTPLAIYREVPRT